jgi:NADPH:quinone reductase-like Zn-dependent oxidoreductase
MLTDFIVLHEDALVRIPEHLSFEEGATLPCAAVTAWNALTGGRRLQAGDTVLTLVRAVYAFSPSSSPSCSGLV